MRERIDTILTVRVEPSMDARLRTLAEEEQRTLSSMVRRLLTEALDARKNTAPSD